MSQAPRKISYEALQKLIVDKPEEAEAYFIIVEGDKPFSVHYIPNPDLVILPDSMDSVDELLARGSFAISLGNAFGRWKRQGDFRKLVNFDLDKYLASDPKNFTCAAEGDSWFHYPVVKPDDAVEILLARKIPVWTIAGAADELQPMVDIPAYKNAIRRAKAKILLFSGGGNDMVGNGDLAKRLNAYKAGMQAKDMLNKNFQNGITAAIKLYRKLFETMASEHRDVWLICHGYDYAIPMKEKGKGKWLYPHLKDKGCPNEKFMWDVVKEMVNLFNNELADLATGFEKVKYVNLLNTIVPAGTAYKDALEAWHDEIHPKSAGYEKVATKLEGALADVLGQT